MTQKNNNNNNNNNETAKIEKLCNLLRDRYAFGFDLDAQKSFLDVVDDLIFELDIKSYDDYWHNYCSFAEFVNDSSEDLFMYASDVDALDFILKYNEDAADTLNECDINPFSDPCEFAAELLRHMMHAYINFEKLEAYKRQYYVYYKLPVNYNFFFEYLAYFADTDQGVSYDEDETATHDGYSIKDLVYLLRNNDGVFDDDTNEFCTVYHQHVLDMLDGIYWREYSADELKAAANTMLQLAINCYM